MKNNYSDYNIKGTLYVSEDPRPRVNTSFRDNSVERIVSCVRNIRHEIYTGFGTSCHNILDNILKEIEKVEDIL